MQADVRVQPNHSRDQILDSAEMLMAHNGYTATSISEVCKSSGLPVGSVYWYFKNKFGLLAAVMDRGNIRFFEELPRINDFTGTGRERFDAWFDSNTELLAQQPYFLRLHMSLALQDGLGEEVRAINQQVRARAVERLSEAVYPVIDEAGIQNPDGVALNLAKFMMATVDGLMIGLRLDDSLNHRQMLAMLRTAIMAVIDNLTVTSEAA